MKTSFMFYLSESWDKLLRESPMKMMLIIYLQYFLFTVMFGLVYCKFICHSNVFKLKRIYKEHKVGVVVWDATPTLHLV